MTYFRVFCSVLTVLWFLLTLLTSHAALALDIKKIRFGQHPDNVRMVLDISEVSDFRVFMLSDPYRMVVDMPNFDWKAGSVEKPHNAMIADIRQGTLMPGVSRLVFDMKQPVAIQSAFLLPQNNNLSTRIVIDYKKATPQNFVTQKNNIHGTLNLDDYKGSAAQNGSVQTASLHSNAPRPPENATRPTLPPSVRKKPMIIIDPGHGGKDPGAVGYNKVYEKNIVLSLSKALKEELLASGKYRVKLTREKDVFIRLKDRVKFARKYEGDLFISIHADSIHKPDVHGTSIYTISKKASDAQTAKLAERENQADLMAGVDFNVEDEQVAFILGDFLMNDTMNQSKFFANTLLSTMKRNGLHTLQNAHRYAGFAVLKAPDIPSILIEAGFVSNRNDARLLSKKSHRRKIAKSIRAGIDAYFENAYKNERN